VSSLEVVLLSLDARTTGRKRLKNGCGLFLLVIIRARSIISSSSVEISLPSGSSRATAESYGKHIEPDTYMGVSPHPRRRDGGRLELTGTECGSESDELFTREKTITSGRLASLCRSRYESSTVGGVGAMGNLRRLGTSHKGSTERGDSGSKLTVCTSSSPSAFSRLRTR
jgi:hypothetical protein